MELTILGTGHATVTKCYNTCFILNNEGEYLLVDAGGGNGILRILEEQDIPLQNIHHMFVSHGHTDHVMGVVWVIRTIAHLMVNDAYEGELNVYCHEELADIIVKICDMVLLAKLTALFGKRIHFVCISDGEERKIIGKKFRFFDILSTKMKQFAFELFLDENRRLLYCGDEPLAGELAEKARDAEWVMHEAFCLYSERDKFRPYEKHHSTVKEACEMAAEYGVNNLILYHTEDTHIAVRKQLYTAEGAAYYSGNLLVPDDGEKFEL